MFSFVVKYLGFLKHLPGLGFVFDVWLRLLTLINNPALLDWMDEIERELLRLPQLKKTLHKYGGVQFNYNEVEIGHIHGNGLLDMLLNRDLKRQLIADGRIQDHHLFKNSGWMSFYIQTEGDKIYAVKLLKLGYMLKATRH